MIDAQHPIPSGYGPFTTAREVLGARRLDGWTAARLWTLSERWTGVAY